MLFHKKITLITVSFYLIVIDNHSSPEPIIKTIPLS